MKSRVEFWRVQLTMCYYFITFNRRVLLIFQNVSLSVSIKLMECLEHMKRKLNTLKCIISPVVRTDTSSPGWLWWHFWYHLWLTQKSVYFSTYSSMPSTLSLLISQWVLVVGPWGYCMKMVWGRQFWWTRFQAEISQAASCVWDLPQSIFLLILLLCIDKCQR